MQLTSALSLAALGLAGTAAADRLLISHFCWLTCRNQGTFITDFGRYSVNGNDGCHGTSVPGMTEFCLDHRRDRGHFRFSHQGHKRCLRRSHNNDSDCGEAACWTSVWNEVACTWREAGGGEEEGEEEIASVSLTIDGPPAAMETGADDEVPEWFEYITPEQAAQTEEDGHAAPEKPERSVMGRHAVRQ